MYVLLYDSSQCGDTPIKTPTPSLPPSPTHALTSWHRNVISTRSTATEKRFQRQPINSLAHKTANTNNQSTSVYNPPEKQQNSCAFGAHDHPYPKQIPLSNALARTPTHTHMHKQKILHHPRYSPSYTLMHHLTLPHTHPFTVEADDSNPLRAPDFA